MIFSKTFKSLVLAIGLSLSSLSFAAQPSDQDIEKFIQLLEIDLVFKESLKQLTPFLNKEAQNMVIGFTGTEELNNQQQTVAQQISQAMYNIVDTAIKSPNIHQELKQTFKKIYTDKEIQAYSNFLSTPEGKSINRKTVQTSFEVQKIMEKIITDAYQGKDFEQQFEKIITPLFEK